MQALLAFLPRPEGGTAKVPREWVEASDWFVIFTLGTLLFLLGAFAMWAWLIWRSVRCTTLACESVGAGPCRTEID